MSRLPTVNRQTYRKDDTKQAVNSVETWIRGEPQLIGILTAAHSMSLSPIPAVKMLRLLAAPRREEKRIGRRMPVNSRERFTPVHG